MRRLVCCRVTLSSAHPLCVGKLKSRGDSFECLRERNGDYNIPLPGACLMRSLHDCHLYGIIDLSYVEESNAVHVAEAMVKGGVDLIQLARKRTVY